MIHTFPYYIQNAVTALRAKGPIPIVSSQTPSSGWSNGQIVAGPRFVGYAQTAASRAGATYIDHYAFVAQAYNRLGQSATTAFYPVDHTHTSPEGANVVAQAFVRGLLCGNSALKSKVNAAGQAVPSGWFLSNVHLDSRLRSWSRWVFVNHIGFESRQIRVTRSHREHLLTRGTAAAREASCIIVS